MKVLVLSDSHNHLDFMRRAITARKPDAVVHLGDYSRDAEEMSEEFPELPFYRVSGNCDRDYGTAQNTVVVNLAGARVMLTHGHLFHVKFGLGALLHEAKKSRVDAVLFGHTHQALCRREGDLWVMNPGTAGFYGASAGWMLIEQGKINFCGILRENDLEEMK